MMISRTVPNHRPGTPKMFSIFKKKQDAKDTQKRSWSQVTLESFSGAWQRNILGIGGKATLASPTLYACVFRIAQDIGKLPFAVYERSASSGVWFRAKNDIAPLLNKRKPNEYQRWGQFFEQWILSKLTNGNAYIFIERNIDYSVKHLHVLDPWSIHPVVTQSGQVAYRVAGTSYEWELFGGQFAIPSSEIIHDREITPYHPLRGIPPMFAAALSAQKNQGILRNITSFFEKGAKPSGIITLPENTDDTTIETIKKHWNEHVESGRTGGVSILTEGARYESLKFSSVEAQMVEQMRYSDEQICQAFGVPPYIVGIGTLPSGMKVDEIFNLYYTAALQPRIEHIEHSLDEIFDLNFPYSAEADIDLLSRMDTERKSTLESNLVKGSIKTPNEARKAFGLAPVDGGDTIYMQQQNFSIAALAKRDESDDPFAKTAPEKPQEKTFNEIDPAQFARDLRKQIAA